MAQTVTYLKKYSKMLLLQNMTSKKYPMLTCTKMKIYSSQFEVNCGTLSASKLGLVIHVTPRKFMVNLTAHNININNFAATSPRFFPRLKAYDPLDRT